MNSKKIGKKKKKLLKIFKKMLQFYQIKLIKRKIILMNKRRNQGEDACSSRTIRNNLCLRKIYEIAVATFNEKLDQENLLKLTC